MHPPMPPHMTPAPVTGLRLVKAIALVFILMGANAFAEPAATVVGAGTADLWGPALRMIASLVAVLAVVGALAWITQRLRNGGRMQTGLIQVVSGISLGSREKVVLLRVGDEEILVGVSPSGMSPLHVLQARKPQTDFSDYMEKPE